MKIASSISIRPPFFTENELMLHMSAAGYDGVDFNFCDRTELMDWRDESRVDPWLDKLADGAAAANLTWVQAHGPMFNMFGDSERDVKNRDLCPAALRACGRLGIPWMVLHPETFPGAFDKAHYDELLRRNTTFFRSLLPFCERYNVGLAIENMPEQHIARMRGGAARCYGGVPSELADMIDALDHPLVGACWDTGHARVNHLDQHAAIASLGARLKVLHIQETHDDLPKGADDHIMPFVIGVQGIDWRGVIAGLKEAHFQGAFNFEFHNAFNAVPEPLFDDFLRLSVKVGRFLSEQISQ